MIKVIGLTGGIGSGKSSVARVVRDQGVPVIDADLIAHQVTEPGQSAYADVAQAWPEVVREDGRIDRQKLAGIVFANGEGRKRLEATMRSRPRDTNWRFSKRPCWWKPGSSAISMAWWW
jgi:dephospho-CoA kinase